MDMCSARFEDNVFLSFNHLAFSLTGQWAGLGYSDRCRGDSLLRPTPRSRHPSEPRRNTGRVSPGIKNDIKLFLNSVSKDTSTCKSCEPTLHEISILMFPKMRFCLL